MNDLDVLQKKWVISNIKSLKLATLEVQDMRNLAKVIDSITAQDNSAQ